MQSSVHRAFSLNTEGRDFVVGDIHGCYDMFLGELEKVNFNEEVDRMFSVGDLVDRGDKNMECLRLIDKPWFHAVKGNHEVMMCDAVLKNRNYHLWLSNGGRWSEDVSEQKLTPLVEKANQLPIAITVETPNGKIGICHAEPIPDWSIFDDLGVILQDRQMEEMLWGRSRIMHGNRNIVENVDYTIHGHTPISHPIALGNAVYIDTGAVYNGHRDRKGKIEKTHLTILNITDPIDTTEMVATYNN